MKLNIQNTFSKELPADTILKNTRRQVSNAVFSYVTPKKTKNPRLLHVSKEMLAEIGLNDNDANSNDFLKVFTGNKVYKDTDPYAMCYGGHQFGNWAGQLGDGRAINLFEINHNNKQWALQLKGAGETPYSRNADGLAVLRSSVREHLCSEAMYHLGIPTTRSLSLSLSGDEVLRDVMYNGNPEYEEGAIVCRLAPTFIRFGSFEILAANQDIDSLKKLTDYTIKHFYPEITSEGKQKYLDLLTEVRNKTIDLIIHWQRVGFVHGVMNTDNMSILGLTIDFGPYGWLEGFDNGFTPNTTDNQHKRYRYGNQGFIGMWNLYKLANALYPLIEEVEPLQKILDAYEGLYDDKLLVMLSQKLGLDTLNQNETSITVISELQTTLELVETDFTIFYRNLANVIKTDTPEMAFNKIEDAFYTPNNLSSDIKTEWLTWFTKYIAALHTLTITDDERQQQMNLVNPKYIFRNYMAQLAIDDANNGNYNLIGDLYELLKNPYAEQPENEKWFTKRPEWARNKIGCSKLSCSS